VRRLVRSAGSLASAVAAQGTKVRAVWRDTGPRGVVFRFSSRVLPTPPFRLSWYALLETPIAEPMRMTGADGRRWARPDESELMTQLGETPEVVAQRFARGDRAVVHVSNDELMAHLWVRSGTYEEDGALIHLGSDERWFLDGFVDPRHRGKRLHPQLFEAATRDLAADGIRRIYSTAEFLNVASIRAARTRGAVQRAAILAIGIGPYTLRRDGWADGPARWHAGRGRPELAIPPRT
jgi:GNAT superfamily N-acetyltransferase